MSLRDKQLGGPRSRGVWSAHPNHQIPFHLFISSFCSPVDTHPQEPGSLRNPQRKAFSYCSWGSPGKNTEVVCHSLLQGPTFCQTSPPWPGRLGWPHTAWLSFTEWDKLVVRVIRLASCLWLWFQSVCPLRPSLRAYRLTWVSLTLDMGSLHGCSRNLYAGQETTVRTGHGITDWFQIGKGVCQGCILSPCLFNLYAEYVMRNAELEEAQAGIKTARRNSNNLRYADDTTLMAESEELKSLLMKMKEGSEKVGLKLNI